MEHENKLLTAFNELKKAIESTHTLDRSNVSNTGSIFFIVDKKNTILLYKENGQIWLEVPDITPFAYTSPALGVQFISFVMALNRLSEIRDDLLIDVDGFTF